MDEIQLVVLEENNLNFKKSYHAMYVLSYSAYQASQNEKIDIFLKKNF